MSFTMKRNDTLPVITATLTIDDVAVDLTDAAVRFIMRAAGEDLPKVDNDATVVSAEDGQVQYDWAEDDTDTAGWYQYEWEVTFADETVRTFPNDDFRYVNILPDLG